MTREEAKAFAERVIDLGFKDETQEFCEFILKLLDQEPCEDCISREQAKVAIRDRFKDLPSRVEINTILNELPSVTSQPKTGHWIRFKEFENGYYHIKCSECGQYWSVDGHAKIFRYCFNCGAKMEGVEE